MLVNLDAKVQHTSMFVNLIHRPTTQIVFSILPLLGFIVPLSFVLIVVKLSNCRLYVSVFVLSISLFVLYLCLPNRLLFLEQITRFHLLLSCPCCTASPVTQFRRIERHRLSISFNRANPGLFFVYFRSFRAKITIFTTNICEKMSTQYMVTGFEPMTFGCESLPITTRPGLPPKI